MSFFDENVSLLNWTPKKKKKKLVLKLLKKLMVLQMKSKTFSLHLQQSMTGISHKQLVIMDLGLVSFDSASKNIGFDTPDNFF